MPVNYLNQLTQQLPDSPTVGALVDTTASILSEHDLFYGHGTTNPEDEAYALVFDLFDLSYEQSEQLWVQAIQNGQLETMASALCQRIDERIPTPYITQRAWFAGLPFQIDDRALIPRSPIAELIEANFEPWLQTSSPRILDLCCGSGCIGIAAAVHMPQSQVDLLDISNCALILAQRNIELHHVSDRVRTIQSDLYQDLGHTKYDVIVTNPPYVPASSMENLPKEYTHEPRLALEAEQDGMEIVDKILSESGHYLKDDGILVAEVGEIQPAVDERYNHLPLTWLEFERGGEGVFLLQKPDL